MWRRGLCCAVLQAQHRVARGSAKLGKVQPRNRIMLHHHAASHEQRAQSWPPTAGHGRDGRIVQAKAARVVEPVDGEVGDRKSVV